MEHVDVKVELRSTFTFTRTLLYIASNPFTHVNFTCSYGKITGQWKSTPRKKNKTEPPVLNLGRDAVLLKKSFNRFY